MAAQLLRSLALPLIGRDGSKSFFASPSQLSHFLASKSSHRSFPCKSKSIKSQVIWSDVKSSHITQTSLIWSKHKQLTIDFFHSRHKKGNIIISKRK